MKKGPITPKGFRDIMPETANKRQVLIRTISDVLEKYKFVPLETPIVEFAETLLGKYGEDEKLIYQFEDRGGRKLALRYDLTVPLARFIANNQELLKPSFSRYQVGECFRGENTQKGRYRQFTQFDFDTVGAGSSLEIADANIIAAAIESVRKIGLQDAKMAINDKASFKNVDIAVVRAIDKIYKVGKAAAKKELSDKGFEKPQISILDNIQNTQKTKYLVSLFAMLEDPYGLKEGKDFFFDPTLARGLDYYTGSIFELKPNGKRDELSVGGGGRYDNLVGMFLGRDIPAVGFSFGIDRLCEMLP
jgi:histidyl-tRNA synthetase